MHLLTYLQTQHHLPRRKITDLIKQKKILINNFPVESFKTPLNENDKITLPDWTIITYSLTDKKDPQQILLFNKPIGYAISKSDPHNPTIYQLLPKEYQHRYYIGRLDKDSRGLVLLTPDPTLVHEYEHPSKQITKTYLVTLNTSLTEQQIKKAKSWVLSPNDSWKQELLKLQDITKKDLEKSNCYQIILSEGKKRHIRRVISALWAKVIDLQRIREGNFELWNLPEWKRKLQKIT